MTLMFVVEEGPSEVYLKNVKNPKPHMLEWKPSAYFVGQNDAHLYAHVQNNTYNSTAFRVAEEKVEVTVNGE